MLDGEYTAQASVLVTRPADEVMRWLTTPDLMRKWILGADKVEAADNSGPAVGAGVTVTVYAARSWTTFTGEIVELGPAKLVRRYQLGHRAMPMARIAYGQGEYERTVTYELRQAALGTEVSCTARTVIPGLSHAVRTSQRVAAQSLQRSLDRLAAGAEERSRSLMARFGDGSKGAGEPL